MSTNEEKTKLYILNKISELDKQIRFLENLGSSNGLNTKDDRAYTVLVGMRTALQDVLNFMREQHGNRINQNRF